MISSNIMPIRADGAQVAPERRLSRLALDSLGLLRLLHFAGTSTALRPVLAGDLVGPIESAQGTQIVRSSRLSSLCLRGLLTSLGRLSRLRGLGRLGLSRLASLELDRGPGPQILTQLLPLLRFPEIVPEVFDIRPEGLDVRPQDLPVLPESLLIGVNVPSILAQALQIGPEQGPVRLDHLGAGPGLEIMTQLRPILQRGPEIGSEIFDIRPQNLAILPDLTLVLADTLKVLDDVAALGRRGLGRSNQEQHHHPADGPKSSSHAIPSISHSEPGYPSFPLFSCCSSWTPDSLVTPAIPLPQPTKGGSGEWAREKTSRDTVRLSY